MPAPRYAAQVSTIGLGGPVLAHRRQVAPIVGVVLTLVGIAVLHPIPVVVTCRPQVGVRFDVGYIEQDLTVRRCVLAHLVVEVFRYLAADAPRQAGCPEDEGLVRVLGNVGFQVIDVIFVGIIRKEARV